MIPDHITLKREAPLECSKDNPRYILVLGFYIGLLEIALNLIDHDFESTKSILNQILTDHIPEHEGLLNKIDYTKILSGKFAERLSYVYDAMLDIWMEIQEESLPHAEVLNFDDIKRQLLEINIALTNLYQEAAHS